MAVTYQPQYRLHGTSTWTNWGAALSSSTLSVVVGNSTTPLSAVTQYDFQIIASDSFGSTPSNLVSATTTSGVSFSSIVVSGSKTFTTGTTDAVVGTIAVTMSSGSFTGTLRTGGNDAASFKIVNVSGVNTLETNGALATAKTYSVTIVADQPGASNTPFTSAPQSIVGNLSFTESPDPTSVTTLGPAITNSIGEKWTLVDSGQPATGWQVAVNGVVDPQQSALVVRLYYTNHRVYQENNAGGWWYKSVNADTWTPTTDPTVVAGQSRQMIFGVTNFSGGGQLTESPAFHTSLGYYPDMTSNFAGQGADGTGGYDIYGNQGFPWVGSGEFFEFNTAFPDPNAAANNDPAYVAAWTKAAKAYAGAAGIANNTYAVRMCREWAGFWGFSPWFGRATTDPTPVVSAATWIAGFRNCVNVYRQVAPNIKICWDYPAGWDMNTRQLNQTQALAFYPGDAYVDIIACDIYFPDGPVFFGDGTSTQAWLYVFGESAVGGGGYPAGFRLQDWAAFAANGFPGISNGGKPIAVPEWGDSYQDGTITTKFLNWMVTPSTDAAMTHLLNTTCVFHTYYDIDISSQGFANANDPSGGRLQSTWAPNRYTNWVNFHKSLSPTYTGTFWPSHFPVPGTGTIPSGY